MQIPTAVVLATPTAADPPWNSVGSGPKPLVPVATKPILFHTLEALHSAGVTETALLVEAGAAPAFRDAVGDGSRWDMTIDCRECEGDLDVPRALQVAEDLLDGEPIVVQRADAMLRAPLRDHVDGFWRTHWDLLALMLVRPRGSELRQPGGYLFSPQAAAVMLDTSDERDPLGRLRRHGSSVHVLDVEGCLACDGSESSLLEANRHALAKIASDFEGAQLDSCEIQGPIVIHPTATLKNSLVRGPAIIGRGARLVESYVGPYTSIGADVRLEGTEIEHSIVMDGAQLLFVGNRLETSIIGRRASIVRRFELPSAVQMSIGDGARVALS